MNTAECVDLSAVKVDFVARLPQIGRRVRRMVRRWPESHVEELVADVVALLWKRVRRLAERGLPPFAAFAIMTRRAVYHIADGRRAQGSFAARDVTNPACQHRRAFAVQSLHADAEGVLHHLAVARGATPARVAALRLDLAAWLAQLSDRNRALALSLAEGTATQEVAQAFGITAARVSQLRLSLYCNWLRFHNPQPRKQRGW